MKYKTSIFLMVFLMAASDPTSGFGQGNQRQARQKSNERSSVQEESPEEKESGLWNIPVKTLGGRQWWSDQIFFHGYRIQCHCKTGHHRLLSPKDVRLAWGTMAACKGKLNELAREKNLGPMTGRVLIIMHGLTRTRGAMTSLADYVEDNSDIQVINVTYASTRLNIDDHAKSLASLIGHLPDVQEINFVGHSMGSIVVRYYLGMDSTRPDPRLTRMVMLAPPNNGSRLANKLQNNLLFKTFWGSSGQELSRDWEQTQANLATPTFDFGIIAGGQPENAKLDNPLLDGKNDLIVTVEETRLKGACDFHQHSWLHSTIMKQPKVHEVTLRFLESGHFVSEDEMNPITSDESSQNENVSDR